MKKVVLLLSGGLDSTVLLHHLLSEGLDVLPIAIDYGQRHRRELESATTVTNMAGVSLVIVRFPELSAVLGSNALTSNTTDVPHGHYEDASMQATVVPNRNAILLMVAAGYAIANGVNAVAYAAHAGDHAIYPDCRPTFVSACSELLSVCHYSPVELMTPFLLWTKRQITARGIALGVPLHLTWSCYEGGEIPCGKCGTCVERAEAMADQWGN